MTTTAFAGGDVGSKEIVIAIRVNGQSQKPKTFANTAPGHQALINHLLRFKAVRICLEATGIYSLDLAIVLSKQPNREVMVVNPRAAHNFGRAMMSRSKTDRLDAEGLAEYAERMPFVVWRMPDEAVLELRAYARRIASLKKQKARAKNQLHALTFAAYTPKPVIRDAEKSIRQLEKQIESLEQAAIKQINQTPGLARKFELALSVKGIAESAAIQLLAELLLLPEDMTNRQWVAYAGRDPRLFESGSSVSKKPRISKSGNRNLREALFMPAMAARLHDPHVRAFYQQLIERGKKPLQAICAVMRKLLHALHGMLKTNSLFDSSRFYAQAA